MAMPRPEPSRTEPMGHMYVLFARLFWVFVAPVALVLACVRIAETGSGWAMSWDVLFFAIVAVTVLARWLETYSGEGQNSRGEPATWSEFRRYVRWLIPLAFAAWIIAYALGNHILAR